MIQKKSVVAFALVLSFGVRAFAEEPTQFPGPQSLMVIGSHEKKYEFCPKDLYPDEIPAALKIGGGVVAGVACIPGFFICAGAMAIGIVGSAISYGEENKISDDAKKVCRQIPDYVPELERKHWKAVCRVLADSANRVIAGASSSGSLKPVSKAPLTKIADSVTDWTYNGKIVKNYEPLRMAQKRARRKHYAVCMSSDAFQKSVADSPSLTLEQAVNLLMDNAKQNGSRFFVGIRKDFHWYERSELLDYSKRYIQERFVNKSVSDFDGIDSPSIKDFGEDLVATLDHYYYIPIWYQLSLIDQLTQKAVAEEGRSPQSVRPVDKKQTVRKVPRAHPAKKN